MERHDGDGVARVLEAGAVRTGDARWSYVVQEWVDGASLEAFAEAMQLGPRGRAELFIGLCEALAPLHDAPEVGLSSLGALFSVLTRHDPGSQLVLESQWIPAAVGHGGAPLLQVVPIAVRQQLDVPEHGRVGQAHDLPVDLLGRFADPDAVAGGRVIGVRRRRVEYP